MAQATAAEACEADLAEEVCEDSLHAEGEVLDEPELAVKGIHLLVNNKWPEAEKLFQTYRETSPLMHAGSSFVTFMQALMTFEDDKLAEAMKALQETEKVCESGNGFMKSMRRKFTKRKKKSERSVQFEDRLQRQIIVADTIMYQAILTFINQDLASYVKGGWLLRKAWKIYDKAYKEINTMYERCQENVLMNGQESGSSVDAPNSLTSSSSNQALTKSASTDSLQSLLPEEVVGRLLGGVSFGYGSFQLCISMMPPKILKIIEWLGFEGDRDGGLKALYFSSESTDMKAPLATFGLLWYHTMIRPFFALDGGNVDAGVEEAMEIIERNEQEYPDSALFLFFKGRAYRLQCKLDGSLSIYKSALDSCGDQREIQLICLHEIGWLHLMSLNWREALQCFSRLKEESRWSKSYYAYLSALCHGVLNHIEEAKKGFTDVFGLVRRKNNQIEQFVMRRAEKLKKMTVTEEYCTLLLLEVLYLWNSLPTCSHDSIKKMIEETGKPRDKKTFHLQSLIEGALYRELENEEMSKTCFEEAIARHQGMKEDQHVAAFAMYELGSILVKSPAGQEEAKRYFNKAKDSYKDFDFENRLNVRVHAALKRMKTEGTPV